MENALLYTFSTIAQALGGAFALLSAFVLYRFQLLGSTMWQDSDKIRGEFARAAQGSLQWYDTLRVQGKYTKLVQNIDAIVEQMRPPVFSEGEAQFYYRLQESVRLHAALANTFRRGAFTTGAVMLGSVAAIPIAHVVYREDVISWLLLVMGVCGFIACLRLYWAVIEAAIYRQ